MPPKKSTATQSLVTDIHESDETLQAAPFSAELTTPTVLPEAQIHDDDNLDDDVGGQTNNNSPIDKPIGDLRFQITDKNRLDVATQSRLMLQMMLEIQAT